MFRRFCQFATTLALLVLLTFSANSMGATTKSVTNTQELEVFEYCKLYISDGWPWTCCQTWVRTGLGWVELTAPEWTTAY